ncbi:hypothetical protein M0220_09760 [Halomonas qinghailakensis]|uniref:Uncharacterized protein n=1 Tax=Halomonas qinghailakensis TaxID=2937790 RepID=A0AA46TMN4_9GAMM|nr:hypothetical protein [Halomonas sp. ZZQ-149]UYO73186.1 hypothetical protein M0220_09760 [Halomonas sp. ZZQ-149]
MKVELVTNLKRQGWGPSPHLTGMVDCIIMSVDSSGQPIHLIGIEFSSVERQIVAFKVETRFQ